MTACGATGGPKPPSLDLPKPVDDLRAVRKGNSAYLTWQVPRNNTDELAIRNLGDTLICRNPGATIRDCQHPVGASSPASVTALQKYNKPSNAAPVNASYVDSVPGALLEDNPAAQLSYSVEVANTRGRNAGLSNVVQVPAVRVVSPPADFKAQVTSEGVMLSWQPVSTPAEVSGLSYIYRFYRQPEGSNNALAIGELPISATQFVDHSFEWQKKYSYRATVVTLITQPGKPDTQVEGEDTAMMEVAANDVFPPSAPTGLQAVFSGAGQKPFVDLIWTPDSEADLAGYILYRHEEGQPPQRLNADPVKTPAYRDEKVDSGKRYFYSVSAIDLRGNESTRSEEATEQVP